MSHKALIDRWPTLRDFADDIGAPYNTAKAISFRGWIPDWYWDAAVSAARKRKIKGVTLEVLAATSRKRAPKPKRAA